MTFIQRWLNVMTLHRRWGDVVLTSCARWDYVAKWVSRLHNLVICVVRTIRRADILVPPLVRHNSFLLQFLPVLLMLLSFMSSLLLLSKYSFFTFKISFLYFQNILLSKYPFFTFKISFLLKLYFIFKFQAYSILSYKNITTRGASTIIIILQFQQLALSAVSWPNKDSRLAPVSSD